MKILRPYHIVQGEIMRSYRPKEIVDKERRLEREQKAKAKRKEKKTCEKQTDVILPSDDSQSR